MSSDHMSDARARAAKREAERQKAREERKAEAAQRRKKSASDDQSDDPNDPLAAERRIWREKQKAKMATGSASSSTSGGGAVDLYGNPLSQEDQLIAHAVQLQKENAQTLKNTIKVARETAVVGAQTINKLDQQTEQFNRMDGALEETNDSLSRSERILRGMKSIGGAITNMFSSGNSKKSKKPTSQQSGMHMDEGLSGLDEKDRARQMKHDLEHEQERVDARGLAASSSSSTADLTSSNFVPPNEKQATAIAHMTANQRAEDDALDELSDVLSTLKEQSQVMNMQLTQHAHILDGLGEKVDTTAERLKKGSSTMKKIT